MSTAARAHPSSAPRSSIPWCANPLVEWLLTEGWNLPEPLLLVERLGTRLVQAGIPVWRIRVTIRTLHPQVAGIVYTWRGNRERAEIFEVSHDILQTAQYLRSPLAAIFKDRAGGIRRRLDIADPRLDYPILEELRAEGATDYVAMPLLFSDGKINAITFAADRPGGFATAELKRIYEMLPVLARLLEVHAMRHTAKTLLDTYLGKQSGERVLNGLIKRGDGENIRAVIWLSDLRDSTELADTLSREDFLGLLNDFLERMAGAVMDHGGTVLKFIGDAVLAIFPIEGNPSARAAGGEAEGPCGAALVAARDALARMQVLNGERRKRDQPALRFGLALHLGEVMYGNVGAPDRLEFTVIGAAANETARLERLCKTLDRPILVSAEFARNLPEDWISLGYHRLRGVSARQEVFTLTGGETGQPGGA